MTEAEAKKAVYDACLRMAEKMGDRLKTMSWFGRNYKAQTVSERKAA